MNKLDKTYTDLLQDILDNVPYLYFYEKQNDIFFVIKRIDQFLPTMIKETNWEFFAKYIIGKFKNTSLSITSEELGDAKARYFGLEKAFRLYKTL